MEEFKKKAVYHAFFIISALLEWITVYNIGFLYLSSLYPSIHVFWIFLR